MRYARFLVVFAFLVLGGLLIFQPNVESKGQGKGQSKKIPAPLPQTGQTTCHDEIGQIVDCIGTGHDGEYQKGVPWPEPRFTINDNDKVTDNLTGLTWLQDANCMKTHYAEIDLHGTDGDGRVNWQQALDFIAGINNGTYPDCGAGYTDWRLPNVRELQSLAHYGFNGPALPNTSGTGQWTEGDPFFNDPAAGFWSATTQDGNFNGAWSVELAGGSVNGTMKHGLSIPHRVWPVRGGQ